MRSAHTGATRADTLKLRPPELVKIHFRKYSHFEKYSGFDMPVVNDMSELSPPPPKTFLPIPRPKCSKDARLIFHR
jgi:hypothetical protein